jgi:CRISPR-associated protein Cmr6
MNEKIRVPENKYFNKSFKDLLYKFFGSNQINSQQFKEINFAYLFNLPSITNEWKIRINEDIENFKWDKDFINSIEIRKKQIIMQLQKEGYNLENFSLSLSWRLVIGLGASHPQETSMTLHHIYGIPYIPGSAIKGVTKHWAVLKFAEEVSKSENIKFEKAIDDVSKALENGEKMDLKVEDLEFSQLIEIFGTQEKQGRVIFFDAYPVGEINLKIDIINPHYPKYYDGKEPPADWDSPMPIKFLSLENTTFRFYLATKVRDDFEKNLLNKARELLFEALSNFGIGAKTSLGYGLFKNNL